MGIESWFGNKKAPAPGEKLSEKDAQKEARLIKVTMRNNPMDYATAGHFVDRFNGGGGLSALAKEGEQIASAEAKEWKNRVGSVDEQIDARREAAVRRGVNSLWNEVGDIRDQITLLHGNFTAQGLSWSDAKDKIRSHITRLEEIAETIPHDPDLKADSKGYEKEVVRNLVKQNEIGLAQHDELIRDADAQAKASREAA